MHDLEVPHDVARRRAERHDRVGVHVRAEPFAAVEIGARTARGEEDEPTLRIDRHHGPHVRRARAAPAVAGPRRARRIRLACRDRIPAPAARAAACVIRADDAALEVGETVVADRGADDDESVHDRRRRRHLIAAAIVENLDSLREVDHAAASEVGARHPGCRVEGHESGVDGAEEDATATRAVGAGLGIEPRGDAPRRGDHDASRTVHLRVPSPAFCPGFRVEGDHAIVRRAEEERPVQHERRGLEGVVRPEARLANGLARPIGPRDA
jgi:hypothetical protein